MPTPPVLIKAIASGKAGAPPRVCHRDFLPEKPYGVAWALYLSRGYTPVVKIYIAGRYSKRVELAAFAARLEAMGHTITSRWLNGSHEGGQGSSSAQAKFLDRQRFAQEDLEDLYAAECTISLTEEPRSDKGRGGRHVEFGVALALGQALIVVGYRENVFHCIPGVAHIQSLDFPDWKVLLSDIAELRAAELSDSLLSPEEVAANHQREMELRFPDFVARQRAKAHELETPPVSLADESATLTAPPLNSEMDLHREYGRERLVENGETLAEPRKLQPGDVVTATLCFVPGAPSNATPEQLMEQLRANQGNGSIMVLPPGDHVSVRFPDGRPNDEQLMAAFAEGHNPAYVTPGVQIYNKAVRDLQPEIIRSQGNEPYVIVLEDVEDWERELCRKLEEEVQEFLFATNPIERFMELADVLAVVRALANLGWGFSYLEHGESLKRQVKGGYNNRQYLVTVKRPEA